MIQLTGLNASTLRPVRAGAASGASSLAGLGVSSAWTGILLPWHSTISGWLIETGFVSGLAVDAHPVPNNNITAPLMAVSTTVAVDDFPMPPRLRLTLAVVAHLVVRSICGHSLPEACLVLDDAPLTKPKAL